MFGLIKCALLLYAFLPALCEIPCAPLKVRDCPDESPKATLVGVYLDDCWEEPCIFKRGQNVTMEMDIELHHPVKELRADILAMALGGISWPGFNKNGCQGLLSEHDCPDLKTGDYFTYGITMPIQSPIPLRTDVKYIIKDENDETLMCWIARVDLQ